MRSVRGYPLILVGFLAICALIYAPSWVLLKQAREYRELDQIITEQLTTDGLFMGLTQSPADYKVRLYGLLKPDIVSLGSSRAMRLRQQLFNVPYFSLGGLVYVPHEALNLMGWLIQTHKPKVVIYHVDFWAFCTQSDEPYQPQAGPRKPRPIVWPHWPKNINRFTFVMEQFRNGRLTLDDAASLIAGTAGKGLDRPEMYGITAMLQGYGFAVDGSITETIPQRHDDEPPFKISSDRIAEGGVRFMRECRVDRRAMDDLDAFVQFMREQGIAPVLIAPAIPPSIVDYLATFPGQGDYIDQWRSELAAKGYEFHDHHDGRSIGAPSAEFLDGIHAGDVAEARAAIVMADHPNSVLAPFIDRERAAAVVRDYAGMTALGWRNWRLIEQGASRDAKGRSSP